MSPRAATVWSLLRYAVLGVGGMATLAWTLHSRFAQSAPSPWKIEAAVPAGVTLIEPDRDFLHARVTAPNAALANEQGEKLYELDIDAVPDQSLCTGPCLQTWTPFIAPRDAKLTVGWSTILRGDGLRQWTYQHKPLYRPAAGGEAKVVDVAADPGHSTNVSDPVAAPPPPPEWHVALFTPEAAVALPLGVSLLNINEAGGYGLVDRDGKTLYAFTGAAREDRQACFGATCEAAMGVGVDRRWHAALMFDYFVPTGVHFRTGLHGVALTTPEGRTLYTRNVFIFQAGGFDIYSGLLRPYSKGKRLGTKGCDAQCLTVWRPFVAPEGATPSGFWEINQRPDGVRQWAYKGYALYTYAGDQQPGDVNGNNLFDLIKDDAGPYSMEDAELGSIRGAPALFWHIAMP